uniref:Transposase n=1 Tax=Chenopodium quinoa TaxID=63459 RepID=A0A803MM95_CHEQI
MILNFCPIYKHRGKAIAKGVEEYLTSKGVDEILFNITVDNASFNDVACSELRKMMQSKLSCIGNGNYMHMRCVAHIINLIVWDGLKKNKKSINKVRYVARFVKSSPSRLKLFKDIAARYAPNHSSLSLHVPTRWNSTFDMLEKALKFRDTFWRMDIPTNPQLDQDTITETHSGYDDNQSGGIGEDDLRNSRAPLESDWKVVEGWMNSDDRDFRLMAIIMQQKFDKYWGDIVKMNVLIYMGTLLDPKVKFVGLKLAFARMYPSSKDEELSQIVYRTTTSLFDDYRKMYTPFTPHNDDSFTTSSRCTSSQPNIFDLKKDNENQVRILATNGRYSSSELDRYLNDQIGEHKLEMDILTWWKMNAHRYPILAHLARDVLAIPISIVASESTFSVGGLHLDSFRISLTPKMVQALISSQDWLRPRKDKERGVEEKLLGIGIPKLPYDAAEDVDKFNLGIVAKVVDVREFSEIHLQNWVDNIWKTNRAIIVQKVIIRKSKAMKRKLQGMEKDKRIKNPLGRRQICEEEGKLPMRIQVLRIVVKGDTMDSDDEVTSKEHTSLGTSTLVGATQMLQAKDGGTADPEQPLGGK